jgi:hypothetical protein
VKLTAAAAAVEVRERLDAGDENDARRVVWQYAAHLIAADPAERAALAADPPDPTGDERFDALLAAVVDHLLTVVGVPVPPWVEEPWRFLAVPRDVEPVPALREAARAVTPATIRQHGVWLDPSELINR